MHYAVFQALGLDTGTLPEGPTTPDLEWPTWIVYSAVPLGSYLMCFRFLQVTWRFVRTGELPHHDHAKSRASTRGSRAPMSTGSRSTTTCTPRHEAPPDRGPS